MDPFEMGRRFQSWNDVLDHFPETAVANSLYWQKWYDLVEVQEIVNNITDPTIIELFTKEPPTDKTFSVLYEKYGEYSLFRKTVN